MLAPATITHFERIASLIRVGAPEGSFDAALAGGSPEAEMFYANLRQALTTGAFVEMLPDGVLAQRAAPGYVFWPGRDSGSAAVAPAGFGLFKAFQAWGHELWLIGLDAAVRGRGYGRAMLAALLATPAGRIAWTARVRLDGRNAVSICRLLALHGYEVLRESPTMRWYLRKDAPPELQQWRRSALQPPAAGRSANTGP